MTATDKSSDPGTSGRQFHPPTHVQVPMLLVERDRRAVNEMVKVLGMPEGRANEMVDAFGRSNHFEALGMLYAWTGDEAPFRAMAFLERHGYWPVGASERPDVETIDCRGCGKQIHHLEPCYFDVKHKTRVFLHARCQL